jgi:hypothetical protein
MQTFSKFKTCEYVVLYVHIEQTIVHGLIVMLTFSHFWIEGVIIEICNTVGLNMPAW